MKFFLLFSFIFSLLINNCYSQTDGIKTITYKGNISADSLKKWLIATTSDKEPIRNIIQVDSLLLNLISSTNNYDNFRTFSKLDADSSKKVSEKIKTYLNSAYSLSNCVIGDTIKKNTDTTIKFKTSKNLFMPIFRIDATTIVKMRIDTTQECYKNRKRGIIFVYHKLGDNKEKFYTNNSALRNKKIDENNKLCERLEELNKKDTTIFLKNFYTAQKEFINKGTLDKITLDSLNNYFNKDAGSLNLSIEDKLIRGISIIKNLNTKLFQEASFWMPIEKEIQARKNKLIEEINDLDRTYQEDTSKVEILLYNADLDDYLLQKKEMMVVILGGVKIQTIKATIQNLKNSFQENITETMSFLKDNNPIPFQLNLNSSCTLNLAPKEQQIPLTIHILPEKKLIAPYNINLVSSKKDSIKVRVHERNKFLFKIGFSGSLIKPSYLKFVNNQLSLALPTDTSKRNQIKSDLMLLLSWSPWGRDLDRTYNKPKSNSFSIVDRIGFIAGLKLSKDPLQSLFLGIDASITKEFGIMGGVIWNTKPIIDTNVLPVSVSGIFNYQLETMKRKYDKPTIFLGITFSPSAIGKQLSSK